MEEILLGILDKHETETYPNGVGSIEYSITSGSYKAIVRDIMTELLKRVHHSKLK